MEKRGAISAKVLISIIILVISFSVILYVYWQFNWTGSIDKETCHQSVVTRSSLKLGPFKPGTSIVKLKCRTEKICFSLPGEDDDCGMYSQIDSPITEVTLSSKKEDAEDQVKDAIANVMYDCQWMLGAGKLDFMPHGWTSNNYCLICSRFAFSEEAKALVEDIPYGDLYQYLDEEKETPTGQNYLSYIYPKWKDSNEAVNMFDKFKAQNPNLQNFEDWKIDTNYDYVVVAQMAPHTHWGKWAATAAAVAGGVVTIIGIASSWTGVGIGLIVIGTTITSGALYATFDPEGRFTYLNPTVLRYDANVLNGLSCDSFETAD